jgi:predicted permease
MQTLWQDLRYGIRMLLKKPGFTAIAVLTLALGIGANTAIFSILNAAFLRPLQLKDPDRLAIVFGKVRDANDNPVSYADFDDWRKQNQSFESMAAYFNRNLNLTGMGEPERLRVTAVTEGYFQTIGIQPLLGRAFAAEEHQGANLVAVVSYGFWQRHFGGAQDALGKTVRLDDKSYTIIGVMPPQMPNLSGITRSELWVPLEPNIPWRQRGLNYLVVLGRLKIGFTIGQAQSDLDVIAERLHRAYPEHEMGVRLVPLNKQLFGDLRTSLLMLLGAVGFVMLIATSNVANLQLARASDRGKEFAVRLALGAGRMRLVRQMLTEGLLLAFAGGALGMALAVWWIDLMVSFWPTKVLRPDRINLDWRVLAFTAGVTVVTSFLFSLIPAWQATSATLSAALKEAGRKSTADVGRRRVLGLLVVSETALATLLLVGAGLMLKSFWLARHVDPGFDAESVLSVPISLPQSRYKEDQQISTFFKEALQSIAAVPGVKAVGAINNLPLAGGGMNGTFRVEGQTVPAGQEPECEKYIVTPDYFRAMGIRLVAGRLFTEQDMANKPRVILVNENMALHFWPNQNPVGKRLAWGNDWQEVVGVVGDVKHDGLEVASGFQSYEPFMQDPSSAMTMVIRTTSDPTNAVAAIKAQVREIDKDQPIPNVKTLNQIVADSVSQRRLSAVLLGAFAALALLLSTVGIYGVLAYSVTQRMHELGVRMALGAKTSDVLRLVLSNGMKLALTGVSIGLAGAFVLTRLMTKLLFGVTPTDATTFAVASALLVAVSLLACYVPARRATKVDPLVALRYE